MSPLRRRTRAQSPAPKLDIPVADGGVLQVCHPDWRGVRASAEAFRDPILSSPDLTDIASRATDLREHGVTTLVIQGWPPGAGVLARSASGVGIVVLAVSHSAPSQHGVDAGEAEALAEALELAREGVIERVGVVKAGVAESLRRLGHPVIHVPNRVPDIAARTGADGSGHDPDGAPDAGIFLFPMWRKNVTTQVLAALELGWTPHVMADPGVAYLRDADLRIHGEMDRATFLERFASMHMNFNVTLSECHPMMPMESYRLGVPCLVSRTSDLFVDDPDLHAITTIAEADDPHAIAAAARRLDERRDEVVDQANRALDAIDAAGAHAWMRFTRSAE